MISIDDIKLDLSKRLSTYRYEHTESVVETALKIARVLSSKTYPELDDVYISKIETAAWLHDSCKEVINHEMITLAEFYGIEIFEEDEITPNLLHARVGAAWVEEAYEIFDPIILEAISHHTLGGVEMELSAKILYLADMIEPSRDATEKDSELEKIRQIIFKELDLERALLEAINSKIKHVIAKNQMIHPLSIDSRNSLILSFSRVVAKG